MPHAACRIRRLSGVQGHGSLSRVRFFRHIFKSQEFGTDFQ
jgi:hypothetical protein